MSIDPTICYVPKNKLPTTLIYKYQNNALFKYKVTWKYIFIFLRFSLLKGKVGWNYNLYLQLYIHKSKMLSSWNILCR